MTDLANDLTATQIAALLARYGFELRGYTALELIDQWLRLYPAKWVRLAVVEALYQGRYKAISVEHILSIWLRRGQPTFHFSYEFERLVFRVLPPASESKSASDATEDSEREEDNELVARLQEVSKRLSRFHQAIAKKPSTANSTPEELSTITLNRSTSQQSSLVSAQENTLLEAKPQQKSPPLPDNEFRPLASKRRAIREFTPAIDQSDFYSKLKAVVRQELDENSE
ncbi:hypothetical protein NIES593_04625 [Hydrococcus rivularis NIES-593]|uniref:Uncharacterized protein n=1 Tax=Hydrococcus rivularis NIES-593 TaxID=1921803 RepID=A0A1U7HPX9_9CYAN|nr:hypothetical protein [Hydrococcus rivularis]OKH25621.1 hypothetical protein NIES593_04625 [Hydrococcus rivularis NIES-593]